MAAYTQHVMVFTGKTDWTSRTEDDGIGTGWGELVRKLKSMMGRGGAFANPYNNVLVTTSSFDNRQMPPSNAKQPTASVLIWPYFRHLRNVVVNDENVENLIRAELLPTKLHATQQDSLSDDEKKHMVQDAVLSAQIQATKHPWHSPVILICGHGGRDARCGTMGPLLQAEFRRLASESKIASALRSGVQNTSEKGDGEKLSVGLVSHIGGHRFAGNVILYFPSEYRLDGKGLHPLAGKGIWYGRVEPKHIEGILHATIGRGDVIKDLFRGGVADDGKILRV